MHGLSLAPGRVALALALPAILAVPGHAQQAQRYTLGGQRVEIFNAVGHVNLVRGSGSEVVIQATRVGADASRLQFATDREDADGASRFRVVYPLDALDGGIYFEENESGGLRLRADGTFSGDGGDSFFSRGGRRVDIDDEGDFRGYADLEIAVPAGRVVVLHLAVGHAALEGTSGDFTIELWSADVEARDITGSYLFDAGSGDVTVTGGSGTIRIDTGSGDVTVTGGSGTIRIDTGSGSGTVSGIRGDLLEIETGSGDADATDVQVARARFETGSGRVRARNVQCGRGEAEAGSGDVEIQLTGGAVDDWTIDTGSGEAIITLPPQANARVSVSTGSGDIDVTRQGVTMERRRHDAMVLVVGDGRGRVRIDTGSGDVTIR